MDYPTFIVKVLLFVGRVIWPVTLLSLGIAYRKPIGRFIDRITRFKVRGWTIEIESALAEVRKEVPMPQELFVPAGTRELEQVKLKLHLRKKQRPPLPAMHVRPIEPERDLAGLTPTQIISSARLRITSALEERTADLNPRKASRPARRRALKSPRTIQGNVLQALHKLDSIYETLQSGKGRVSRRNAISYWRTADQVVLALQDLLD